MCVGGWQILLEADAHHFGIIDECVTSHQTRNLSEAFCDRSWQGRCVGKLSILFSNGRSTYKLAHWGAAKLIVHH